MVAALHRCSPFGGPSLQTLLPSQNMELACPVAVHALPLKFHPLKLPIRKPGSVRGMANPPRQQHQQSEEETAAATTANEKAITLRNSPEEEDIITPSDVITLSRPLSITDLSPEPTHGSQLRVAHQGAAGAHSEEAALIAYPNCVAIPCEDFESTFQAVENWVVDRSVLPIENSLGGSIHRNYDLLLRYRLHIVGEVQMIVHHCLLGLPGVKKEDIRRVISHPQALAQCEDTLSALSVVREAVDDSAGAAQFIADYNLRDTGAVASARAGELYGLNIIADGIQDERDNITRFLMLAREPIVPRVDMPFKTSITFTLDEGPGVLFKALAVFALRDINLTKIESRPLRNSPLRVADDTKKGEYKSVYFDYLFFLDFEVSMADPRAQNALAHLQEITAFLRVLGSYPMDTRSQTNFQA